MDEAIELYRGPGGVLETAEGRLVTCSWFAVCSRPAEGLLEHPALGAVPICGPCRAVVGDR